MTDSRPRAAAGNPDVAPMPTFLQPEPVRQDLADPALTTVHRPSSRDEPTEHHRPDDGPDFGTDSASDVKGANQTDGPSRVSTGDPVRVRPLLNAQQIAAGRALAESILMGATALLNRRTRVAPDDDRWLMTAQERASVAAPLGRIVARRSPIPSGGDGGDATDLADGVEAVVALVSYVIGQMTSERPAPVPAYVAPDPEETPEPAGPGAQLSPFDPAYRAV